MKPIRDRNLNCDKLAELLRGPEALVAVRPLYSGYDGDTEAMREDWKAWRDCLKAFWASGEYTTKDILPKYGIDIWCHPGLWIKGEGEPCWAERAFDGPE